MCVCVGRDGGWAAAPTEASSELARCPQCRGAKSRVDLVSCTSTPDRDVHHAVCRHHREQRTAVVDDDVERHVLGCRVDIIIRDKLLPMRVHGSILLYIHRNRKAH